MKTTSTVNSKKNGTLKMKKENNNLRNLLAGLLFASIAFAGMSFTTTDTTKTADTVIKTKVQTQDSCCIVSITNNKLVVTTGTAGVEVTNASIEKLMAKSFTQLSLLEISLLDNRMDVYFKIAERNNTDMAVAFRKMLLSETFGADNQLSESFAVNVLAPAYGKNLSSEMQSADDTIDELIQEEAELTIKTRAYKSELSVQITLADENMDQMIHISSLKNFEPNMIQEADRLMDAQIQKEGLSPLNKSEAKAADLQIDKLINKN